MKDFGGARCGRGSIKIVREGLESNFPGRICGSRGSSKYAAMCPSARWHHEFSKLGPVRHEHLAMRMLKIIVQLPSKRPCTFPQYSVRRCGDAGHALLKLPHQLVRLLGERECENLCSHNQSVNES